MKKTLAVILFTLIVFTSLSPMAGAFGTERFYEISYGETVSIEIPDSFVAQFVLVQFIPEESGHYALTSSSDPDLCDPYCVLMDGDKVKQLESADDEIGYDFRLEYEFEAGKLYYFGVFDYNGATEFEVALGCAHSYIDGFCERCSEECPHLPSEYLMGFCSCGKFFSGSDIKAGERITVSSSQDDYSDMVLRFIPEEDGTYIISSVSSDEETDPYAELLDKELNWLWSSDDVNGYDFSLAYEFVAGQEYIICVGNYGEESGSFDVTVEKAVHQTESGESHPLTVYPENMATCSETGYTEGLYCEICEKFISGHEEIPMEEHWDYNADGICELCGGDVPLPDCSHICHNRSPFISFLWKIINMFNKLFMKNAFCECGAYHFA